MGNAVKKPFRRQKIQKGFLKEVAFIGSGLDGKVKMCLQNEWRG